MSNPFRSQEPGQNQLVSQSPRKELTPVTHFSKLLFPILTRDRDFRRKSPWVSLFLRTVNIGRDALRQQKINVFTDHDLTHFPLILYTKKACEGSTRHDESLMNSLGTLAKIQ